MNSSGDCQDFIVPVTTEREEEMYRNYPWRLWVPNKNYFDDIYEPPDLFMATNNNNSDIFHIMIKVEGFRTKEISVKTGREMITIECLRPEKLFDGGWESCHIVRRIPVPEGVNLEKINEWISNKVLTILAPIDHEGCKPIDKPQKRNKAAKQQTKHKRVQKQKKQKQNQQTVQSPNQASDEAKLETVFKDLSVQPGCSTWDDADNLFSFFYDAQPEPANINNTKNVNNLSEEESPITSQECSEDSYDLVSNQLDRSDSFENAGDVVGD